MPRWVCTSSPPPHHRSTSPTSTPPAETGRLHKIAWPQPRPGAQRHYPGEGQESQCTALNRDATMCTANARAHSTNRFPRRRLEPSMLGGPAPGRQSDPDHWSGLRGASRRPSPARCEDHVHASDEAGFRGCKRQPGSLSQKARHQRHRCRALPPTPSSRARSASAHGSDDQRGHDEPHRDERRRADPHHHGLHDGETGAPDDADADEPRSARLR